MPLHPAKSTRAFVVALLTLLVVSALAASASAQVGGIALPPDDGGDSIDSTYGRYRFGYRDLQQGMRGDDVKTLNWLLRSSEVRRTMGSRAYASASVPFNGYFDLPTDGAVRSLQVSAGMTGTGVVDGPTRKTIAASMRKPRVTWYGPGFWGARTACGTKLSPKTVGVAHRKLPCGTKVTFAFRGRYVRAKVIDRGPYTKGYKWDLTKRLAKRLGYLRAGRGHVRAAVVR